MLCIHAEQNNTTPLLSQLTQNRRTRGWWRWESSFEVGSRSTLSIPSSSSWYPLVVRHQSHPLLALNLREGKEGKGEDWSKEDKVERVGRGKKVWCLLCFVLSLTHPSSLPTYRSTSIILNSGGGTLSLSPSFCLTRIGCLKPCCSKHSGVRSEPWIFRRMSSPLCVCVCVCVWAHTCTRGQNRNYSVHVQQGVTVTYSVQYILQYTYIQSAIPYHQTSAKGGGHMFLIAAARYPCLYKACSLVPRLSPFFSLFGLHSSSLQYRTCISIIPYCTRLDHVFYSNKYGTCVVYTECKLKSKNGGGLGMRLPSACEAIQQCNLKSVRE